MMICFPPGDPNITATEILGGTQAVLENQTIQDQNDTMSYFEGSSVIRSCFLQIHPWLTPVALAICFIGATANIFLVSHLYL